ncbi:MAG: hypothetical protein ABSH47_11740 [Bryobacteraceae bacterium]|jgi:hypothetical protein
MDEIERKREGSIWAGFGLAAAINVAAMIVGAVTLTIVVGIFILLGIGLIQAAWIVPMVLRFRATGRRETMKGVIIAAAVTFLLNASCWGLVATIGLGSMH